MPSERRLHPLSFLFGLTAQVKDLLIPGLVVLVGAGSFGGDWQVWLLIMIVPSAIAALGRTLSYRYRFDPNELVIRHGFIFRNERHVPYARIQNVDAVQNPIHRLLGVVEVRVETGGGDEPEARMSVLPVVAFHEIRDRVSLEKQAVLPSEAAAPAADVRTLLRLPTRELLLCGLVENRGIVIVGTAFGLIWELGFADGMFGWLLGEQMAGRGVVRQAARSLVGLGAAPVRNIALAIAAFMLLLIVMRVISMAWSFIRLNGFTLTRHGDDLRTEFGLFTRVNTTIPVRRIQSITIRESPLERLLGRASVRVDTAGSDATANASAGRESLAPIIRRSQLPVLIRELLPELDFQHVDWTPVAPRAFRRALIESSIVALLVSTAFVLMLRWWTLIVLALLMGWAVVHARQYVRRLGWSLTGGAVLFRSGWIWRHASIARFSKIQIVAVRESPFDRRSGMASVSVDTPGAGDAPHRVNIPYLLRETADRLGAVLAGQAARTAFKW